MGWAKVPHPISLSCPCALSQNTPWLCPHVVPSLCPHSLGGVLQLSPPPPPRVSLSLSLSLSPSPRIQDVGLVLGKRCLCFCSRFPHSHHEQCGVLLEVAGRMGTQPLICSPPQTEIPPRQSPLAQYAACGAGMGFGGVVGMGWEAGGIVQWGGFGGQRVAPWGQGKGQCPQRWQVQGLSPRVVARHRAGGAHVCVHGICMAVCMCAHRSMCAQACSGMPKHT